MLPCPTKLMGKMPSCPTMINKNQEANYVFLNSINHQSYGDFCSIVIRTTVF
jgi:hypothetical protein